MSCHFQSSVGFFAVKLTSFRCLSNDEADLIGTRMAEDLDEFVGSCCALSRETGGVFAVDFGWFLAVTDEVYNWWGLYIPYGHISQR